MILADADTAWPYESCTCSLKMAEPVWPAATVTFNEHRSAADPHFGLTTRPSPGTRAGLPLVADTVNGPDPPTENATGAAEVPRTKDC